MKKEVVMAFGNMFTRARLWRAAKASAVATLILAITTLALAWLVPLPERLSSNDSTMITWRDGSPAHLFLSDDDKWRVGVSLDEVDPQYIEALVALEDERFWVHPGVDPIAIGRATLSNIQYGEVVSGASTITMQLVRVLEPRPRTLRSKIIEAARAVQLELRMSKHEILANYLRFAPYGRNIEGLDAASLAYFGHRADALSNAEIATLLAVPQAPNARYPRMANARRLRAGRDEVARELLAIGELDLGEADSTISMEQALEHILAEEVPTSLYPFPREIPHTAYLLRGQHQDSSRIDTTLDEQMQKAAERLMRERRAEFATQGIHNGAVVLVDHTQSEVRALVGNFDFNDARHGGQIPGFITPRSTGSLLKPTITAMAMEQALVHPKTVVRDIPIKRANWTPENFTNEYAGLIPLDEALARSLNIPFIELIEQIGQDNLLDLLDTTGFEHLDRTPGHYGLGIAVGGVEATPLEIAGLYATFARGGEWREPALVTNQRGDAAPATRLFSTGTTWLVQEALAQRERPDQPWRAKLPEDWKIHWKTGTSNKNRDAWSAGSVGDLTAVVWLGNFSNAASPSLVGGQAAAPVMFDVLEALVPRDARTPEKPSDLKTIEVCAFSGHQPGPACSHKLEVDVPLNGVPMAECPYHQHIEVTVDTGERVSASCRGDRQTTKRTIATFEPELAEWLGAKERARAAMPAWAPGCQPLSAERPPRITSPRRGRTILLIPGIPPDRQRVPLEASTLTQGELSWFVDGEFVGSVTPGDTFWWPPTAGDHELVAMDASGRATRQMLAVERRQVGL